MSDRERQLQDRLRAVFGPPWRCHVNASESMGLFTLSISREKVQLATSGRIADMEAVAVDLLRYILAARDSIDREKVWEAVTQLTAAAERVKP